MGVRSSNYVPELPSCVIDSRSRCVESKHDTPGRQPHAAIIEIDATIRSVASISKTKKALYVDMKKRYNWNDSQCKAAIDPILKREYPKLK